MTEQEYEKKGSEKNKTPSRVWLKAFLFLLFILAALCLLRFFPVKNFLTPENTGRLLKSMGFWAPLLYVLIYATCICLLVPATFPTLLGAAVFGTHSAFFLAWAGAMTGASAAFVMGRTLGRGFVAAHLGDRLRKFDDAIERNGFTAVLYLRLIQFPFTPLNFGMGLTKVHFRDYFLGTGAGIAVGLYILTFFGGAIKEVWISGTWEDLYSPKMLFAAALFVFSFFIPRIANKIKFGKHVKSYGK